MQQYTSPAVLGQGFKQGLAIGGDLQRTALDAATIRAQGAELQEKMKPIPLDTFSKNVPDFLKDHVLKLAEANGIVEQNGDMKYIRGGNARLHRKIQK